MAATKNNVFYDIATQRLDAQMQQIDQLDAKAATVFASASGIIAIFAGLLSLSALPSNLVVKVIILIALLLACIVYGVLIFFLYMSYRVKDWSLRPCLSDLQKYSASYDDDAMQEWVADECVESIHANDPMIADKAWNLKWALLALPVEAVLLVIAGGVALLAK